MPSLLNSFALASPPSRGAMVPAPSAKPSLPAERPGPPDVVGRACSVSGRAARLGPAPKQPAGQPVGLDFCRQLTCLSNLQGCVRKGNTGKMGRKWGDKIGSGQDRLVYRRLHPPLAASSTLRSDARTTNPPRPPRAGKGRTGKPWPGCVQQEGVGKSVPWRDRVAGGQVTEKSARSPPAAPPRSARPCPAGRPCRARSYR